MYVCVCVRAVLQAGPGFKAGRDADKLFWMLARAHSRAMARRAPSGPASEAHTGSARITARRLDRRVDVSRRAAANARLKASGMRESGARWAWAIGEGRGRGREDIWRRERLEKAAEGVVVGVGSGANTHPVKDGTAARLTEGGTSGPAEWGCVACSVAVVVAVWWWWWWW